MAYSPPVIEGRKEKVPKMFKLMRRKPAFQADSTFWVEKNTAADVSWSKPQAFESSRVSSNEKLLFFYISVGGQTQVYEVNWHWHWFNINKLGPEKMKKLELFSSKNYSRNGEREMKHARSISPTHFITWPAVHTNSNVKSPVSLWHISGFYVRLYNVSHTHMFVFLSFCGLCIDFYTELMLFSIL